MVHQFGLPGTQEEVGLPAKRPLQGLRGCANDFWFSLASDYLSTRGRTAS